MRIVARVVVSMFTLITLAVHARADAISQWNQQVVASGGPQNQRTFAMVHVAMFEAANAVERRYLGYLALPAPPAGASAEAAAAGAAYGVLVRLFPAQQPALAATLVASLAEVPDGPGETDGVAYGDLVAQAVHAARLGDNILAPGPVYTTTGEVGDYQLTTPGPPQPVNTNAPNWKPFALQSVSQFRPEDPPALTSKRYARDLAEVQRLGSATGGRTADEDQVARWHTEGAPLQFNRIARAETATDGRDMLEHARLFALLNLAMADGVAAVFEAKYAYRFWRPSTAIRNADVDGNDDTDADASWTPFLTTPPHPEYPSAHSVIQAAGARVMERYFGNHYAFATTSAAFGPSVARHYESFDAYAEEGRIARLLGGMHFRSALEAGAKLGKSIGNWVLGNYFVTLDGEEIAPKIVVIPRPQRRHRRGCTVSSTPACRRTSGCAPGNVERCCRRVKRGYDNMIGSTNGSPLRATALRGRAPRPRRERQRSRASLRDRHRDERGAVPEVPDLAHDD